MKNTAKYLTIMVLFGAIITASVRAHCQVPCGIYDDEMRVKMMYEHVTTITKAMQQIEAGQNANQTTRWVMNKEKHAEEIIEIVSDYFLAQRIKEGMDHYEENLKTLHQIIVYSMKCKQTTDVANAEKLQAAIHTLEHTYFGEKHQH
ncbi:superoxide dismutase [Ni] [Pontiella sp.]|uniref:superoxide dismutase [Ni] n=1 Tax=Pontiella sp. TaxID=2837462 RepID=UPI0035676A1E